jgi:hypothetical protein
LSVHKDHHVILITVFAGSFVHLRLDKIYALLKVVQLVGLVMRIQGNAGNFVSIKIDVLLFNVLLDLDVIRVPESAVSFVL